MSDMTIEEQIRAKVWTLVAEILEIVATEAQRDVAKNADVERDEMRRKAAQGRLRPKRRRTTEELEALVTVVKSFLEGCPGAKAEHVATSLGLDTRSVRQPLRLLVARGVVRKEGQKRATRYFVATVEEVCEAGAEQLAPGEQRAA